MEKQIQDMKDVNEHIEKIEDILRRYKFPANKNIAGAFAEQIKKETLDKLGVLLFNEKIRLVDETGGEVSFQWIRSKLNN